MSLEDHFRRWFCGDEAAVHFAVQFYEVLQQWDDVEDEKKPPQDGLLNWLAFEKEYHPFFAAHSDILRPVFKLVHLSWRAANVLDHEPDQIAKSYMLRAAMYQFFHVMAWICGGNDWAEEIGPEIYRMYGETLDDLQREFGHMETA